MRAGIATCFFRAQLEMKRHISAEATSREVERMRICPMLARVQAAGKNIIERLWKRRDANIRR